MRLASLLAIAGPVAFCGLVGAIVSKAAKVGTISPVWVVGASVLAGIVWAWIVKKNEASLAVSGAVYDVVYGLVYFATFLCLGEKVTPIQGVGILLSVAGIVCLGW